MALNLLRQNKRIYKTIVEYIDISPQSLAPSSPLLFSPTLIDLHVVILGHTPYPPGGDQENTGATFKFVFYYVYVLYLV